MRLLPGRLVRVSRLVLTLALTNVRALLENKL
jgi:hypothetical protein